MSSMEMDSRRACLVDGNLVFGIARRVGRERADHSADGTECVASTKLLWRKSHWESHCKSLEAST